MRLLVTRPEPDAEHTAAALRERGHSVVAAPMLRIEPSADAQIEPGPWAAILVTSANAARAIGAHVSLPQLRALPVFAVGQRSAQAMRTAGFADVTSADGDVSDLARLVAGRLKPGIRLLYLTGAERFGDLAGDLGARGFSVHQVIIYRAVALDSFTQAAVEAFTGGVEGVLHFSRRSAEAYVNAARAANLHAGALEKAVHFCLSGHVAEPLARAGALDIRIASRPAEAALIELIPPS